MTDRDEYRTAARIATLSALLVVSGFVASKAARDAILLTNYSVRTLPLFIGISALLSLPIILLTSRLMTRFGPHRLVPWMNFVSGALLIGEFFLLRVHPHHTTVLVFFHLNTAGSVLVSGFWSTVNERFDIQTAKRHIGRIGVGATLGGILGGLLAERAAVMLEPNAILIVLGGLQIACALALVCFANGKTKRHHQETTQVPTMRASLSHVVRTKLLRIAGAIVVLSAVAAGLLDYVFKADLTASHTDGSLLRAFAMFYTVTNIITAVIQLAVCGPLITRIGVPKSVGTLPLTVTGLATVAAIIPSAATSIVARAGELITRNSVYRAGYELLYAPLGEEYKRPTKVVLDVGADKLGDIIGAQIVGAMVLFVAAPRASLILIGIGVAVACLVYAVRLPKAYTEALEQSLLAYKHEEDDSPAGWSLTGMPSMGDAGDRVPLRLRRRKRVATPVLQTDVMLRLIRELRSGEVARIKLALAQPLSLEMVGHVIQLAGNEEVAPEAYAALAAIGPACTGAMVDALLDAKSPLTLRRRLPSLIGKGNPDLATWGLWHGLKDVSFEVRYRCGRELTKLSAEGHIKHVPPERVFEIVIKEIGLDHEEIEHLEGLPPNERVDALNHVFALLGLTLPAQPLRVALQALREKDPIVRATALEYLESILPPDVRVQLWPMLEQFDHSLQLPALPHARLKHSTAS